MTVDTFREKSNLDKLSAHCNGPEKEKQNKPQWGRREVKRTESNKIENEEQ